MVLVLLLSLLQIVTAAGGGVMKVVPVCSSCHGASGVVAATEMVSLQATHKLHHAIAARIQNAYEVFLLS